MLNDTAEVELFVLKGEKDSFQPDLSSSSTVRTKGSRGFMPSVVDHFVDGFRGEILGNDFKSIYWSSASANCWLQKESEV